MKRWPQLFFIGAVLVVTGAAGAAGAERERDERMAAPLAEMMLYEAAEQAVEDSYARIIPEPEGTRPEAAINTDATQLQSAPEQGGGESANSKE